MTLARLFCCTSALALAACATPGRAHEPTTPASGYRLCSDPAFQSMCTPASVVTPPEAIRVDTNMATPAAKRSSRAV